MYRHKSIQLDVLVPKARLWEFLEAFGNAFARSTITDFGKRTFIRAVDSYQPDPRCEGQIIVTLGVLPEEENDVSSFLQRFNINSLPSH